MFTKRSTLQQSENGQVAYSTLFIVLFLVVAGAVFATTTANTQTEVVQQVMLSLVLALLPVLIIISSTLWLVARPVVEATIDSN